MATAASRRRQADRSPSAVPPRAGVALKPAYYARVLEGSPDVGFFEVHAENYMGAGGPPHRYLSAIRERYPLSLHGVGLSIGTDRPLDREHLKRLKALIERYEPALFSEHLAWSSHGTAFLDDLLPLPYTTETLECVVRHVDEVQEALGCQMLLENPSTYVAFEESTWPEVEFIAEIARRTGCALLLDVNNVHVACTNQQWDAAAYIERFPLSRVREIHLAGHSRAKDDFGRTLLVDSHDDAVAEVVWSLYELVIARIGPVPTLIERDAKLPPWGELHAEAARAERILRASASPANASCDSDLRDSRLAAARVSAETQGRERAEGAHAVAG